MDTARKRIIITTLIVDEEQLENFGVVFTEEDLLYFPLKMETELANGVYEFVDLAQFFLEEAKADTIDDSRAMAKDSLIDFVEEDGFEISNVVVMSVPKMDFPFFKDYFANEFPYPEIEVVFHEHGAHPTLRNIYFFDPDDAEGKCGSFRLFTKELKEVVDKYYYSQMELQKMVEIKPNVQNN